MKIFSRSYAFKKENLYFAEIKREGFTKYISYNDIKRQLMQLSETNKGYSEQLIIKDFFNFFRNRISSINQLGKHKCLVYERDLGSKDMVELVIVTLTSNKQSINFGTELVDVLKVGEKFKNRISRSTKDCLCCSIIEKRSFIIFIKKKIWLFGFIIKIKLKNLII